MNIKKIDYLLLQIVISRPSVEQIQYITQSGILNNDENILCEKLVDRWGIIGNLEIKNFLMKNGMTDDEYQNINKLTSDKLILALDDLIIKRRDEQNADLIKNVLADSSYSDFTKESIDVLNGRYMSELTFNERNVLEDLEDYYDEPDYINNHSMSTGIEYIDKLSEGIPIGELTSIIGLDEKCRHILAINIAYNQIIDNKNVLMISFDHNQRGVYLDLLSRHSCCGKFEYKLSRDVNSKSISRNQFMFIYEDFKDMLRNHFKSYDYRDFNIQNVFALRRLIAYANEKFVNESNEGIDLLIIEDIDKACIQNSKKVITNKSIIQNEYYTFLKNMAFNFLGTKKQIPIVITNSVEDKSRELVQSMQYINIGAINESIVSLSSMIISVFGDDFKKNIMELSILKSPNKTVINQISVQVEKEYNLIHYNDECITYTDFKDKLLQYKIKEVEDLNKDIEMFCWRNDESINLQPLDIEEVKNDVSENAVSENNEHIIDDDLLAILDPNLLNPGKT